MSMRPWKAAEEATVKTMLKDGAPIERVAAAINRTPRAVQERVYARKKPKWGAGAEILKLMVNGPRTQRELAGLVGASERTVARRLAEMTAAGLLKKTVVYTKVQQ